MFKTKNVFTAEERDAYMDSLQKDRLALSPKYVCKKFGEPVQIDSFVPNGESGYELRSFWGIIKSVDTERIGVIALHELDQRNYYFVFYGEEWVCVDEDDGV